MICILFRPLIVILLALGLAVPASSGQAPAIGDYEVRLYDLPGWEGNSTVFILKPNMRHRLMHSLGKKWYKRARSIQVGNKVKVWVFLHEGFQGDRCTKPKDRNHGWPAYFWGKDKNGNKVLMRDPKRMNEAWDRQVASLIIYPREQERPLGVMLYGPSETRSHGLLSHKVTWDCYIRHQFFPLPEKRNHPGYGLAWIGNFMALAAEKAETYGRIKVEVFNNRNFYGKSATLGLPQGMPSAGSHGKVRLYDLEPHGLKRHLFSLRIHDVTPVTKGRRAPASPPAIPQVHGTWKDSLGAKINFGQKGANIWWRIPALNIGGGGKIEKGKIKTSIIDDVTRQTKAHLWGYLRKIDNNNYVSRIEWSDGTVLTR